MDYRQRGARSPKRDHPPRKSHDYSPIRRYRSRTRSRSPLERRPSYILSPKLKRSRSRSPRTYRYQRRDMNGSRRTPPPQERKSRIDVEKPEYWGPKDRRILSRAVSSPHRIVVVRKTDYDDVERNSPQKDRDECSPWHRAGMNYSRSHEDRHSVRSASYGESKLHKKYSGRSGTSHKEDCNSRRCTVPYEKKNSRRWTNDRRPYQDGRSRSSRGRDKLPPNKPDEEEIRGGRGKRQNERRYQNDNKKSVDRNKDEKPSSTEEEKNEENEEYDHTCVNGVPIAGVSVRPFPFSRVIPIAPYPIPFRPPHLLPPRFPRPFLPRPFVRLPPPPPRVFPPNRFFPPVPPMY